MVPQGGSIAQTGQVLVTSLVELMVKALRAPGLHVKELRGLDAPGFRLPFVGSHIPQPGVLHGPRTVLLTAASLT